MVFAIIGWARKLAGFVNNNQTAMANNEHLLAPISIQFEINICPEDIRVIQYDFRIYNSIDVIFYHKQYTGTTASMHFYNNQGIQHE